MTDIKIVLEDGSEFCGQSFGYQGSVAGEVVFDTAMSGYPESLADPSYRGQILVMTYPLAGNYGVPQDERENGIPKFFESDSIQVAALAAIDYAHDYSHWRADKSLDEWMKECRVPGIYGIDARALTKRLREKGSMNGKIIYKNQDVPTYNSCEVNLVEMVSCRDKIVYGNGSRRVLLIDCGVRYNIIRSLLSADATVVRIPWNYDFSVEKYDGIVISNGPGDPKKCAATIKNVAKTLKGNKPVMGICLGGQIMGLAAGADTFKLKHGHHGRNQPVMKAGSDTTFITAQNHSFAVDTKTLPEGWEPFYVNLNDGTNEGFRHKSKPFFSTQFHPEPSGEAPDKEELFSAFINSMSR